jgi:glucosyl-dolichyl phosphate glucuronosyltransferase
MTAPSSVSVVICTHSEERLRGLLDAIDSVLRESPPPDEVIVVVDHNQRLEESIRTKILDPCIQVVPNRFSRGLSGARNTGVAQARGQAIFFLDDDAVVAPDCIARLVNRLADPTVIGVGARIEPYTEAPWPRWFPTRFAWVVGCTEDALPAGELRNLIGAAMCFRRSTFDVIGGFDDGLGRTRTGLPLGCEETEICIRASRAIPGGRFVFEPGARVVHTVPASRLRFRYFLRRCLAEGISKARLAARVGAGAGLASERLFVVQIVSRMLIESMTSLLRNGDPSGFARAGASLLGIASAALGYAPERLRLMFSPRPAAAAPAQESSA